MAHVASAADSCVHVSHVCKRNRELVLVEHAVHLCVLILQESVLTVTPGLMHMLSSQVLGWYRRPFLPIL